MNVVSTIQPSLSAHLEIGRHMAHVKRNGLADQIGGFTEWAASIGYSRQQADRLVRLAELTGGSRI